MSLWNENARDRRIRRDAIVEWFCKYGLPDFLALRHNCKNHRVDASKVDLNYGPVGMSGAFIMRLVPLGHDLTDNIKRVGKASIPEAAQDFFESWRCCRNGSIIDRLAPQIQYAS